MSYQVHLWNFLLIIQYFSPNLGCQEPWTLSSPHLTSGNLIHFKNASRIGSYQSFSWRWTGSRGQGWLNSIALSPSQDEMSGLVSYGKMQKRRMVLKWRYDNDGFWWNTNNRKMYESTWAISMDNGLEWNFTAGENGSWRLVFGNWTMDGGLREYGGGNDSNPFQMIKRYHLRMKRSEDFEEHTPDIALTKNTTRRSNCFYDFFFGKENQETGQRDGIFTKIIKWALKISCAIHKGGKNCQDGGNGQLPTDSPLSPTEPEAVTMTTISNNVESERE